jgi:hypothetical protein
MGRGLSAVTVTSTDGVSVVTGALMTNWAMLLLPSGDATKMAIATAAPDTSAAQ